ncbi:MAG: hypothetical protein QMD46_10845 [Methanomicrobiales archaeon]|nr:hypothetical protein [Methanomicrobiales archaeon]MDI6876600.1 hypothetical protein [Methanomicrobiales archaeon]
MDPNRILSGGIFRLKRIDGEVLIQMPSDAERYGRFWERVMFPDGTVLFRPRDADLSAKESVQECSPPPLERFKAFFRTKHTP